MLFPPLSSAQPLSQPAVAILHGVDAVKENGRPRHPPVRVTSLATGLQPAIGALYPGGHIDTRLRGRTAFEIFQACVCGRWFVIAIIPIGITRLLGVRTLRDQQQRGNKRSGHSKLQDNSPSLRTRRLEIAFRLPQMPIKPLLNHVQRP